MGDRSNVFIQMEKRPEKWDGETRLPTEWDGIGLYAHWGGTEMQETALIAARESVARLGDSSYFARRVVHKILNTYDQNAGETGHGLWTDSPPDNEHPVLVINAETGQYWYTAEGSIHLDPPAGVQRLEE